MSKTKFLICPPTKKPAPPKTFPIILKENYYLSAAQAKNI